MRASTRAHSREQQRRTNLRKSSGISNSTHLLQAISATRPNTTQQPFFRNQTYFSSQKTKSKDTRDMSQSHSAFRFSHANISQR